jgi:hypothetical protein
LRKDLNIRVRRPITDPRIQKTVDWIAAMNRERKAASTAFALLVMALNGELGQGIQETVAAGSRSTEEALQALDAAVETWIT